VLILAVSMLLAAILGLSAQRAGICTVKAVAELFSSRRPYMLLSFSKTSLWAAAVMMISGVVGYDSVFQHWPIAWLGVSGGLVFGVGAGVNGGCVFSTLTRAVDGNFNMLGAVLMWPAGALIESVLARPYAPAIEFGTVTAFGVARMAGPVLTLALGAWAVYELTTLFRHAMAFGSVSQFVRAARFKLSAAAALIGICNGFLFYNFQNWSFTSAVVRTFAARSAGVATQTGMIWILFLSAALGMILSAQLRASFVPTRPSLAGLLRHGAGGLMMGAGAAMIPGGNDALILYGIPSFSPHAVPSFLAILAGIALVFLTARLTGMAIPRVICRSDVSLTN